MEKIKQAISKARSESNNKQGLSNRSLTSTEQVQKLRRSTQAVMRSEDELDELSYTQTKVVTLNQKSLERNRVVAHDKSNSLSPVFDMLRTEVLRKMEANGWRSIAVVSATPESGKTFVSINLAMSIAHQPHKSVLLVDFDLRRPKVAQYMGLSVDKSLNDYLAGSSDLSEVLVNPGVPRLVLLPTNKPVSKSSEVLSTKKVEQLITEIRERYESRVVIYDLPPLLNVDDARIVIPQADCVLLVVANGQNSQDEIIKAKALIPEDKLVGYVFNKAEQKASEYYYY